MVAIAHAAEAVVEAVAVDHADVVADRVIAADNGAERITVTDTAI